MKTLVFESHINLFISILSMITILLVIIFLYKKIAVLDNTTQNKVIKLVYKIFSIFILLFFMLNIFENYKVQRAFKLSNYQVIKGKIQNFKPMHKSGHAVESFDVNDIHFFIGYTGNYPTGKSLFYTLTKNRKGPIKENEQIVTIFYLNIFGKNKIIKMWLHLKEPWVLECNS